MDSLNDRLTEQKKRSRELQWAMEKERCETGRNEESKREELEVCFSLRFPSEQRWTFQYTKHPKEYREMIISITFTFIHC